MEKNAAVERMPSGRDRELSMLVQAHEEARERAGARMAFVSGPRGIGKSHLFDLCRRTLADRGVRVFEGGASRSSARAYGLFADMVPELLAYLPEVGVPARTVAELARRTAPLAGIECAETSVGEDRRLDLFDAVAEVFALAGRACPAFLFSDADAADRASLELLRYVAASCLAPGARAAGLFVVSLREEASAPPLLAELMQRTPAVRVPLQGLDLDGIRAFLSRRDVAERLLDATGGIPLALEDAVVPNRPVDLFSRRVASRPEAERDTLLALAVFGAPASSTELSGLVAVIQGGNPDELTQHLDRLVRDRIVEVRVHAGEPRYAIARDSEREKLLNDAHPDLLKALHNACGELLEARGGDPERIARHFLAADPSGKGCDAAIRAGEALQARYAFDEAAEFFRIALDLAPRSAHADLHERLAFILGSEQDYVGALRHIGLARRDRDAEGRRALRAEAARLCMRMGRLATAERLGRMVLETVGIPAAEDAPGVRAFVDCAEVLFLRGKYEEAAELCGRGLATFSAPEVQIELRNTLGKIQLTRAALAEAAVTFEENAEQARACGLKRELARALINQGVVAHRRGDRRAAINHYRAGLQEAGADRALAALALSNLGSLYADSAEFDAAIEHLSRALGSFTRARRDKEVAHCAINLAHLHLFLGDLERARELGEHAQTVAGEVGDPYLLALARLLSGELHEASGAMAEAVHEMTAARAELERLGSPRYAAEASLALARLHLSRGAWTLCSTELSRPAIDEVARTSTTLAAERDLLAGELALVSGALKEASSRLSAAKELLLESPDLEGPYRVYHLLSKLRAAAGDAHGAAQDAARAVRLLDELTNRVPVAHRTAFLRVPRRAAVLASCEREITPSTVKRALSLEPVSTTHGMVGKSPALQKIFKVLEPVARSPATVLIRGESGTGKELLADAIHRRSPRRDMPFVKVNCAAMVEELLMSELFGHEKGAFTGAVRERKGRFELADGGTIFLDEIGDISPKCQVALLRVLQEREFERVGGTKTLRVDVRVVCATNRDLEAMIARGEFRQDLYYRLKGVMLELPPLRDRPEDLPGLCEYFLAKFARERQEEKKSLSAEALALLQAYDWPGNIRELENVLSSASIFATGQLITPEAFEHVAELASLAQSVQTQARAEPLADEEGFEEDAASEAGSGPAAPLTAGPTPGTPVTLDGDIDFFEMARSRGLSLKDLRQQVEEHCIRRALTEAKGNISEAARLLKMKRSRLSQIVNSDPQLLAVARGD